MYLYVLIDIYSVSTEVFNLSTKHLFSNLCKILNLEEVLERIKKNSCETRAYKMKIEVLEGNITPYSPNSHTTDRFFKILGLAFVCLSGIKVSFPSSFSRMFFF